MRVAAEQSHIRRCTTATYKSFIYRAHEGGCVVVERRGALVMANQVRLTVGSDALSLS